jgi:hypothetical protein
MAMVLLTGAVGLTVLMPAGASGAPPATTTCTSALSGGRYNKIVVPYNATCSLTNVTVKGDVVANTARELDITDSTIGGNVLINGSPPGPGFRTFNICAGSVGGDVRVSALPSYSSFSLGGVPESCSATARVGGNVRLHDNSAGGLDQLEVSGATIGGNLEAINNTTRVEFDSNAIGGDRRCVNNGVQDIDGDDPADIIGGTDNCVNQP